jgi:hypothetical protein
LISRPPSRRDNLTAAHLGGRFSFLRRRPGIGFADANRAESMQRRSNAEGVAPRADMARKAWCKIRRVFESVRVVGRGRVGTAVRERLRERQVAEISMRAPDLEAMYRALATVTLG